MPGLNFYFQAFQDLQTERQIGMGAGPIPWSSILKWAEFYGLTDLEDFDVLHGHIRAMEDVLCTHEQKEQERKK